MKTFGLLLTSLVLFINSTSLEKSRNEVLTLEKWNGVWETTHTIHESIWNSESYEVNGIQATIQTLDQNYQESSFTCLKNEIIEINQFNENTNEFQKWIHDDTETTYWRGLWNESKQSMTWTYVDLTGSGFTGTIVEKFISDIEMNRTLSLKDAEGNVLQHMTSQSNKIESYFN